MRKIDEEQLHYIWLNRLLKKTSACSVAGKTIEIIDPGKLNTDAGPDFFNAKIKIDGLLLAGNVEIHLKSSDWIRHNHQSDKSYDKIILHAVLQHDRELEQNKLNEVEVLELKNLLPELPIKINKNNFGNKRLLPCYSQLKNMPSGLFREWAERMQEKRSLHKLNIATEIFEKKKGDARETFYVLLLKNFGCRINDVPFEMLADALPLKVLLKYQDHLFQLKALLLGTAGFLETEKTDSFFQKLKKEYDYLKTKHDLTNLNGHLFKFSRMRPGNSPITKLIQFANLFHSSRELFDCPQNYTSYTKIISVLNGSFFDSSQWRSVSFGKSSSENLIINTFSVFFFLLAKKQLFSNGNETGISLLSSCTFENNFKTRFFTLPAKENWDAKHSQGLIQLYDELCSRKKCLQCAVGRSIIKEPTIEYKRKIRV